jgi:putative flippase GtrA
LGVSEAGSSEPARISRFALVGVVSTLLYALGSLVAYVLAGVFSYTAHRSFTFRSDRSHREAAPRFIGLSLVGYGIATAAPLLLTDWAGLPNVFAVALTSLVVPALNFVLMRAMVFVRPSGQVESQVIGTGHDR